MKFKSKLTDIIIDGRKSDKQNSEIKIYYDSLRCVRRGHQLF